MLIIGDDFLARLFRKLQPNFILFLIRDGTLVHTSS